MFLDDQSVQDGCLLVLIALYQSFWFTFICNTVLEIGPPFWFFLQLSFVYMCVSEAGRIGSHPESSFQDTDFGGGGNQYVILLGNLDKGLSPSMVSEFIKRETFVSPQVYICPNFTSDTSTQGALMLDCEKQFQKLSEFLDRPNQIIISSGGRYVKSYALYLQLCSFKVGPK